MANNIFANGRELSCKSGSGKSICCFPDVCFTPPQTPATPPGVPIPYPNTGMTSDSSKGTRDVKITKKEVMMKNKSSFKKSMGDQAGCAPKKGVVTSKIGGKVYFNSWSMDVKVEGENAVRHLDLTTHNHGSVPGNTPTWPFVDQMAGGFSDDDPCKKDIIKEQEACKKFKPYGDEDVCEGLKYEGDKSSMTDEEAMDFATLSRTSQTKMEAQSDSYHFKGGKGKKNNPKGKNTAPTSGEYDDCLTARSCQLVPYKPRKNEAKCCPSQTAHHLVEASSFFETGRGAGHGKGASRVKPSEDHKQNVLANAKKYKEGKAPSICAWGPNQHTGTHGCIHTIQGNLNENPDLTSVESVKKANRQEVELTTIKYKDARDNGVAAAKEVNPKANCQDDCMKAQLDAYHTGEVGVKPNDKIKCVGAGATSDEDRAAVTQRLEDLNEGPSY